MSWSLLLLLACPLMMLFCMKGMSGNKGSKKGNRNHIHAQTQQSDLQSLQIKMAELMEQNHQLTQEVENLKNPAGKDSNVVRLKKAENI